MSRLSLVTPRVFLRWWRSGWPLTMETTPDKLTRSHLVTSISCSQFLQVNKTIIDKSFMSEDKTVPVTKDNHSQDTLTHHHLSTYSSPYLKPQASTKQYLNQNQSQTIGKSLGDWATENTREDKDGHDGDWCDEMLTFAMERRRWDKKERRLTGGETIERRRGDWSEVTPMERRRGDWTEETPIDRRIRRLKGGYADWKEVTLSLRNPIGVPTETTRKQKRRDEKGKKRKGREKKKKWKITYADTCLKKPIYDRLPKHRIKDRLL